MSEVIATVGLFDGVHLGHQFLAEEVKRLSPTLNLPSMAVTFDNPPHNVLPFLKSVKLLTTVSERLTHLQQAGFDNCRVLPFTKEFSQLSAKDFMQQVLCDELHAKALVVGYDNRFGHKRTEGPEDYVRYGKELGMQVVIAKPKIIDGIEISSTVIREYLSQGNITKANQMLGYSYYIKGVVIEGRHIGTSLGFPTANIGNIASSKLIPLSGAYHVEVSIDNALPLPGALNIGTNPTIADGNCQSLEVHILNFSGNLYGHELTIHFKHRLRDERKFSSLEELKAQLQHDIEVVRANSQEL